MIRKALERLFGSQELEEGLQAAEMCLEFGGADRGIPVGRPADRVRNLALYAHRKKMNNEFGWGGTTDADLRKRYDI